MIFPSFFSRGDAFLESYIDGLARSQGPVVSGAEDEDQDSNLIRPEEKQFLQDGGDFADGRDFKFNNLSQVSLFIFLYVFKLLHYKDYSCINTFCVEPKKVGIILCAVNRHRLSVQPKKKKQTIPSP